MAGSQRSWSSETDNLLRTIFKRCVQCESGQPTCPSCPNGQVCSLVPQSCNACAYMTCIGTPNATTSSSPNVGAIAGGVIGGIAAIALIMFLLWRFWFKKKRAQRELEAEQWRVDDIAQQKGAAGFNAMRSDAASTRTRASFANSILSRASNIIQIAYIPGVTNRNGSGRNSIAPVPPIPAAYANSTPRSLLSSDSDALFFRPGDLRGSTYSDTSTLRSDFRNTQYSRQSITPSLARSSVVSSVYRDDATVEPMPATTLVRAAPRMVSVKGQSPRGTIASRSAGASPLSRADSIDSATETQGRAHEVVVTRFKGRFPVRNSTDSSSLQVPFTPDSSLPSPASETFIETDDEDEHWRARQSLGASSVGAAAGHPENPFSDRSPPRRGPYTAVSSNVRHSRQGRGVGSLTAVAEETPRAVNTTNVNTGAMGQNFASPFSDIYFVD